MAVQLTKTISAYPGDGITFELTKYERPGLENYNLDILWANGESALDYGIQITIDGAESLIEALQLAIADMKTIKGDN